MLFEILGSNCLTINPLIKTKPRLLFFQFSEEKKRVKRHNFVLGPQSVSLIQQKCSLGQCQKILQSSSQVFQCSTEVCDWYVVILIRNVVLIFCSLLNAKQNDLAKQRMCLLTNLHIQILAYKLCQMFMEAGQYTSLKC